MLRTPTPGQPRRRQPGPTIKNLRLKNFKAFGNDIQSAPMSRITLLYGPNSGGKSSVIQALLLLKQSEGNLPRGAVLTPQGEYVDLAGFKAMVHKHDEEQEIEIDIKLSNRLEEEVSIDLILGKDQQHRTDLPVLNKVGYELKLNDAVALAMQLNLSPGEQSPHEETANFSWADTESSIKSYSRYLHKNLTERPGQRPSYPSWLARERYPRLASFLKERDDLTEDMRDVLRQFNLQARSSVLPSDLDAAPYMEEHKEPEENSELTDFKEYALRVLPMDMETFARTFQVFFERMSYLGPILDDPRRFHLRLGGRRSTVGKRGEYTFDFISYDDGVRDKVNDWFGRFSIPYQIKNLRNVAASELTGTLSAMALEDTRTGTILTPVDVGFGISQLLPVIVEGIAGTSRIVCVDQPEVHLHPKLQAEIADLMIECRSKQWIVETHSELLVRRILRRIAEGVLKPSDVSVLYVDPSKPSDSKTGSIIKVLEIEESGKFSSFTPWPQGFFEDGYQEMMATIQAGG